MLHDSEPQRIALVIGSTQSVGRGIALRLAAAGVKVAVNSRTPAAVDKVVAEIAERGGQAIAAPFDVTSMEEIQAAVAKIEREHGGIDILVNSAGSGMQGHIAPLAKFKDADPETWRGPLDLHLLGALKVIRAVLPGMSARGWGRVIQISSGTASRGHPIGRSMPGAAKAAIEGALRHIAIEEAASGVTINAVALGLMSNNAGMSQVAGPGAAGTGTLAGVPIGRFIEPDEVGAAVVWLSSAAGAAVTGQTIHVNGGTIHGR